MSKKALIVVVIALVAVVAGVILIFGRKTPATSPEAQEVAITRPSELGGGQLINHAPFRLTITLPSAWQVTVFDNPQGGKGSVSAYYLGEGMNASVFVNRYKTSDTPSVVIIRENRAIGHKNINKNGVPGVSYETKETEGNYPEGNFIENSYILVNKYLLGDETAEASCHLLGLNYRTLIPTCETILNSLQFIR